MNAVLPAGAWLFVPSDRPDRFDKALATGATVIVDLEDSVDPLAKNRARTAAVAWLGDGGRAWVRVNAPDTSWYDADLAALTDLPGLAGLVVPMAEDPDRLPGGSPVLALVETALGVQRAYELACATGVVGLAFGSVDYALDLGAAEEPEAFVFARGALVNAARAAGLPGPIDGVTRSTNDPSLVAGQAVAARRAGFSGKLCIHPAQVPLVAQAFRPSPSELAWAERVLAGATGSHGVAVVDGAMVDAPVVARARHLVALAQGGSA